jgi:hypothetical protein
VFHIRDSWDVFDNYIESINKKYKNQYKRARKKADRISKGKLSLEEIKFYNTRIRNYIWMLLKCPFNFLFTRNHLQFSKSLKTISFFYGYFIDDNLMGFNTLIKKKWRHRHLFSWLWWKMPTRRKCSFKYVVWYDWLFCKPKKLWNRLFIRTALEIKALWGAKAVTMYGLMKHSNPFINFYLESF